MSGRLGRDLKIHRFKACPPLAEFKDSKIQGLIFKFEIFKSRVKFSAMSLD